MHTSISVACPGCRTQLKLNPSDPEAARIRVRCPSCGDTFVLRRRHSSGPSSPTVDARRAYTGRTGPSGPAPTASSTTGPPVAGGSEEPSLTPGTILQDRYRIVRFVAKGGMGEVYEAEDQELRERVALKTVRPDVARDVGAIDRFKREIQLARRVTHPNVCRLYDVSFHRFEDGSVLTFLTMELLDGETLGDLLQERGSLSPGEALPLVRQMAAGLHAAHQAGIVHRDFKSRNVILVEQRVVITDFGLARGTEGIDAFGASLTVAGGVLGTPAYMAPEQVEGGEITPAVDLYALGVVLFEMLTGEIPFQAENALSTAVKRLQEPPPSPRALVPDLGELWERVILRCLERRPEDRYPDAEAVVEALEGRSPTEVPADSTLVPGTEPPTASPVASEKNGVVGKGSSAASDRAPEAPGGSSAASGKARERFLVGGLLVIIALIAAFGVHRVVEWRRERALLEGILPAAGRLPGEVRARPSMAVLGFRDLSSDGESGWIGAALGEMLAAELAVGGRLRVVPGDSVARMKAELALEQPDALPPESLTYARSLLGADYLVAGTYRAEGRGAGQNLYVEVQLQEVDGNGEERSPRVATGNSGALLELVSELGLGLREDLGVTPPPAEDSGALRALLPTSGEAARLYSGGLERLRRFDPVGANDLLQRAVLADPENAMARSALSTSWLALGYQQRALEEARRAFELSGSLPSEERLWVEARYREMGGDWSQAETLYRTLWNTYPDDLEYGLQLAAVQTAAGSPAGALATLEALEGLLEKTEEGGARDPRVELARAAAAAVQGDVATQLAAAGKAAEIAEERGARLLLGRARVTECWALRNMGRPEEALAACREGEARFSEAGDTAGVAFAVTNLANLLFDQGEPTAAQEGFQRTLELYREVGDNAGLARTLNNLAVIHKQRGELEEARRFYDQSLELCRRISNPGMEVYTLHNLGGLATLLGELDQAEETFLRARDIYRNIGDRQGEASSLDSLAVVLRKRGEMDAALSGHRQALAIRRELGQRIGEATSLVNLGKVELRQGRLPQARERFEEGLALSREIGNRSVGAEALEGLAGVLRLEGDLVSAEVRQQEVLEIRRALGERGNIAESHLALAQLALEAREFRMAADEAVSAADEFRREGRDDELALALALEGISRIRLAQQLLESGVEPGDPQPARAALEEARQRIRGTENPEVGLPVLLLSARAALATGRPQQARQAQQALDLALRQARGRFKAEELEARLLQARVRNAAAEVRAVEEEARSLGYGGIARRAAVE